MDRTIDLNHLDKSQWQTFRFDEIAQSIGERVDPNETELDVYVGLEHLDSESLHIRRHGTRDDVNGTKLRFYSGDVIFGRRRAYQRKAAIATMDGFCSAHAMVLRAKPDVIDPDLFPFFLHSDAFMNRAVDISVGSLSPTINWKSLREQEFLIPPKDQQAKLAELLWAGDGDAERAGMLLVSFENIRLASEKEFLISYSLSPKIVAEEFFDSVRDGTHATPKRQSSGFKLITSKNIKSGLIDTETDYFISHQDYEEVNRRSKVDVNDILLSMIGTVGLCSRVTYEPDYAIKNVGLFKTGDPNRSKLGFYFLRSGIFQAHIERHLSGTTQKYLPLSFLRKIKLPDYRNVEADRFVEEMEQFDLLKSEVVQRANVSLQLLNSLINQIF